MRSCPGSAPRRRTAGNASSITSSRTSRTSSTSDPALDRAGEPIPASAPYRLVHPFPSILDAIVTGFLAALAGGGVAVVGMLAISMLFLQFSIGAVNDLADAAADGMAKPWKPIPTGVVPARTALVIASACATAGLVLAAVVSPATLVIAALGLGLGFAYDLRLKGTAIGWLPFAVGIPLLPLFAWIGATGTVPPAIVVLSLIAAPAGAALAIANALPDLERDAASGVRTPATTLGRSTAWAVDAILQGLVVAVALVAVVIVGTAPPDILVGAVIFGSIVGIAAGVILSGRPSVAARQRGWELQAVALGGLAAGWVGAMAAAGRL
ncbi:MAG: UbiA prenyltransferase family protein [Candidatus Limnocylindrales bacterium]